MSAIADPSVAGASSADCLSLALVPSRRAAEYVRHLLAHPIALVALSCATSLSAVLGGALVAAIVAPAVVAAGGGLACLAPMQRLLERDLATRAKRDRERGRLLRLEPAGPVRQQQYVDLRDLVDGIERAHSVAATRYELQALLDQYVEIAVAHTRYRRALDTAMPTTIELGRERSERTKGIIVRRQRHHDASKQRLDVLADHLEAVEHLVRLIAARAACPQVYDTMDAEIDRRVCELDLDDEALRELAALDAHERCDAPGPAQWLRGGQA